MPKCSPCLRRIHQNCHRDNCDCTCKGKVERKQMLSEEEYADDTNISIGHNRKSDFFLKDQQSTGRKRAAKLYPLDRTATCEWANQKDVGGGISINGCGVRPNSVVGLQQSRHHGPDYSTLNNAPDNVHRICHSCHNTWHSANDSRKDENYLKRYGHKASKGIASKSKVIKDGVAGARDEE